MRSHRNLRALADVCEDGLSTYCVSVAACVMSSSFAVGTCGSEAGMDVPDSCAAQRERLGPNGSDTVGDAPAASSLLATLASHVAPPSVANVRSCERRDMLERTEGLPPATSRERAEPMELAEGVHGMAVAVPASAVSASSTSPVIHRVRRAACTKAPWDVQNGHESLPMPACPGFVWGTSSALSSGVSQLTRSHLSARRALMALSRLGCARSHPVDDRHALRRLEPSCSSRKRLWSPMRGVRVETRGEETV